VNLKNCLFSFRLESVPYLRGGLFLFLFLIHFHSIGQRVYSSNIPDIPTPTPFVLFCDTSFGCPFDLVLNSEDIYIGDGDLSTYTEAFFNDEGKTFFGVIFSEVDENYEGIPFNNKKVGIKLGFKNDVLNSGILSKMIENIKVYPFNPNDPYDPTDENNLPIPIVFDPGSITSELKFGDTSFEIVTDIIQQDFYGVLLVINNEDDFLTNLPLKFYEFYIVDSSCEEYVDYIYSNSLENGRADPKSGNNLDLNPGGESGELDISFLFDSFSYSGDSVSMIFENIPDLTISYLSDYFEVQAFSDNVGLDDIILNSENSKLSLIGANQQDQQLTFFVSIPFNRIKLSLKQNIKLKRMYRKTGGEPLRITPNVTVNSEGKYVYREGEIIILKPSLPNYSGSDYEWCFDLACLDRIVSNTKVNDVDYVILSDGSLEIKNLPFIESFIVYLKVTDPVSGCDIIKKIDFEVEGIVLPVIDFDLKGKPLPNETVQLNWKFEPSEEYRIENLILEKAKDDLLFSPVPGLYNSKISDEFSFIDAFPFNGNNFYRISLYSEIQKRRIFSEIINVPILKKLNLGKVSIYPNPFREYLSIDLGEWSLDGLEVQVFSLEGKEIINLSGPKIEKSGTVHQLNLGFLNKGVYILIIRTSSYFGSHKIIKE
jgi:hypothetical protein